MCKAEFPGPPKMVSVVESLIGHVIKEVSIRLAIGVAVLEVTG
jgi:hypothetical protein